MSLQPPRNVSLLEDARECSLYGTRCIAGLGRRLSTVGMEETGRMRSSIAQPRLKLPSWIPVDHSWRCAPAKARIRISIISHQDSAYCPTLGCIHLGEQTRSRRFRDVPILAALGLFPCIACVPHGFHSPLHSRFDTTTSP